MTLDILTPIGLGLLGFIEPCSLGANAVFLRYVMPLSGWRRVAEALGFTLARGLFLGLIGAAAGAVGGAVLVLQRWYILALGVVFVFLGVLVLAGGSRYRAHSQISCQDSSNAMCEVAIRFNMFQRPAL